MELSSSGQSRRRFLQLFTTGAAVVAGGGVTGLVNSTTAATALEHQLPAGYSTALTNSFQNRSRAFLGPSFFKPSPGAGITVIEVGDYGTQYVSTLSPVIEQRLPIRLANLENILETPKLKADLLSQMRTAVKPNQALIDLVARPDSATKLPEIVTRMTGLPGNSPLIKSIRSTGSFKAPGAKEAFSAELRGNLANYSPALSPRGRVEDDLSSANKTQQEEALKKFETTQAQKEAQQTELMDVRRQIASAIASVPNELMSLLETQKKTPSCTNGPEGV